MRFNMHDMIRLDGNSIHNNNNNYCAMKPSPTGKIHVVIMQLFPFSKVCDTS